MPNHGKGGRKPEGDEVKRSAVAVRTTPTIKARLAEAAEEAGRSVTQEIEARLEASLAYDQPERTPETIRLLGAVAADIERAEKLTGKRWHKDVVTWAMVREAMAEGEIERQCPETDRWATDSDGDVHDRFVEIVKLKFEQDHNAETLAMLGMSRIEPHPASEMAREVPRYDFASMRDAVEALPDNIQPMALTLIGRMETADNRRRELEAANKLAFKWLAEAIQEGVNKWHADLRSRGISPAKEYRPSAGLGPLSSWSNAGIRTLGDLLSKTEPKPAEVE